MRPQRSYRKSYAAQDTATVAGGCGCLILTLLLNVAIWAASIGIAVWVVVWVLQTMGVM